MKFINFKTTCMIYTLINFSFGLLSMLVSDRVLNFIGLESTNSTELLIKNIGSFFISLSLLSILLSIFYGLFTFLFFGISYYNYNLIEHHQFT